MKTTIADNGATMVATFEGRLDTAAAVKTGQDIQPLIDNADKEIVLDCHQLDYISSSGLRLFLSIRKAAAAKGGKVIIEGINSDLRQVFTMTGFFNLFEIRD
ncbi:MAG: STAS domain-containing protein [Prevotella sp.]|nr:STAS domain-containing protein [Prevotella sp.]